jgi:hypothetical protein
MKRSPVRSAGLLALAASLAVGTVRAGYIDHTFDSVPFTNGATFVTPVLQWQASTSSVVVVTNKYVSASQSVLLPSGSALSNAVAVTAPQTVWTELRVLPDTWGDAPEASATSGVAVVTYFGSGGYLNVWTNGGWLTCSQDVWGAAVGAVNTGVWAAVAIYQNFSNHTAAVLVNDRVVVQDLPFAASFANYGAVRLFGSDYDAWLDDAYVSNTYAVARHTANSNGVYGADAAELQAYGYVARTLYVGGSGYPGFATIQAAVDAARPNDTVYVYAGSYAESVTITGNVTFTGQSFTNSGSLTFGAGVNVTVQNAATWSNTVTIGSNATVTFAQALACSSLVVRAGAELNCQAVTCSNALVEGGAQLVCAGALQCGGAFAIGTNAAVNCQAVTCSSLSVGAGAQLTCAGALQCGGACTIGTGAVVTFSGAVTAPGGAWDVAAGATVLLSQGGSLGTLMVTGTVTLATGQSLSVGSATVYGAVVASGASTVTVSGTLSVPVDGNGHLDFSGGNLSVPAALVNMTGIFSITNTWGTQATVPLDFSDDFELYAANTRLADLGFRGWGVTDTGVVVGANQGVGSSKALTMPGGAAVSNRVAGAGAEKVWMDVYVRPALGEAPDTAVTNNRAFLSYVGTNGLLNVWAAGAWSVCSNDYGGGVLAEMTTGAYTRVTVFLNYGTRLAAVFVGDRLVRQMLPFADGTAAGFNNLWAQSENDSAAMDNVRVATTPPADLLVVNANTDLNGDNVPDALAIHTLGTIAYPQGAVFKFK